MKTYGLVFLFLIYSCAPSGGGSGGRSMVQQGSLLAVNDQQCSASSGEWDGETCDFEIPIPAATTGNDCTGVGGTWSVEKNICVADVSMGAVIAGVKTREECITRDGFWIGDVCYVNEDDLASYDPFNYSYTEEQCAQMSGIWLNDYCTLPGDVSYEGLLQDNNPCNFNSESYNEYSCLMTSQSRCEVSTGLWDSEEAECICEEPMKWSEAYLSCGYYDSVEVKYNEELMLEIYNPSEGDFFPIYILEMDNDWAAHTSWVLRNDVFGTLVSSWEGVSGDYALAGEDTEEASEADSNEGDVKERKCYMRFKIKNATTPSSTDSIKNGDLVTLEAVGLCEDEEHCDVYFNRETSVSIASSVGIGIGIGIAAVGILAATVATGGALAGAVAGAGAAAVVTGTGAATVGVATGAAATAGAAAGTTSALAAVTATTVASTSAITAAASTAGAAAGAAAAVNTVGFAVMGSLAATAAAIGSGVAAASIDWGHLMAYDEYIESDINLEWSEFTGSDEFLLEIHEEGEDVLTAGGDPDEGEGSLSFYLTSRNSEHEDRDGFYIKTDDEVVMAHRSEDENGNPKLASEQTGGDAQKGGPSRIRVKLCGSFCKTLEPGLTCWND